MLEPRCVCGTQAEAALDDRFKHFEDENKQMTTVQVADNDIVDISVGGTIVSTKRSTLTQVILCVSKLKRHAGKRIVLGCQIQWTLGTVP